MKSRRRKVEPYYNFQEKCWAILNWAEYNKDFDTKFVLSVSASYGTRGQEDAIDNIVEGFNIDLDKWAD